MSRDRPQPNAVVSTIDESTSDDVDAVLDALGDARRRTVVRLLQEESGPVSLDELAKRLAASESDDPADADGEEARIALYHVHLPKLTAAGLVEYDEAAAAVRAGDAVDRVRDVIEFATE